jgi:hypothetical protein
MSLLDPQRHDPIALVVVDYQLICACKSFNERSGSKHVAHQFTPVSASRFNIGKLGADRVGAPFTVEDVEEVSGHTRRYAAGQRRMIGKMIGDAPGHRSGW